jgi:hypothetical protein
MTLPDRALVEILRARAGARRAVRLSPEPASRLADALNAVMGLDRSMPKATASDELTFTVEAWSLSGRDFQQTLARVSNLSVARATFAAAAAQYPERRIRLRQRTHLLEDTGAGTMRDDAWSAPGT